jgi:hypothetical protein
VLVRGDNASGSALRGYFLATHEGIYPNVYMGAYTRPFPGYPGIRHAKEWIYKCSNVHKLMLKLNRWHYDSSKDCVKAEFYEKFMEWYAKHFTM